MKTFDDKCDGIINEQAIEMKDPKKWKIAADMGMTIKVWMLEVGAFDNDNFKYQIEDELHRVLKFIKANKGA